MRTRFLRLAITASVILLAILLQAGDIKQETKNDAPSRAEAPFEVDRRDGRAGDSGSTAASASTTEVMVTAVVDGDTIDLVNGDRVRLIGIDAPERGEDYYDEAKTELAALVLHTTVTLERDVSDKDRYGRLLRYVYVDGTLINLTMVRKGHARAFRYAPDTRHATEFAEAERVAREAELGMWP